MISVITESEILDVALYDPNNVEYIDEDTITEEEMDEIVLEYLLENFEFEDEDHLLEVFEDLTEDEYLGILEEVIY